MLPSGGISVHDWRTLHGSGPNTGRGMRCSLALHMRTGRSWFAPLATPTLPPPLPPVLFAVSSRGAHGCSLRSEQSRSCTISPVRISTVGHAAPRPTAPTALHYLLAARPRSNSPGDGYLDQFLHNRSLHCCPVILGDPSALKGDRTRPTMANAARL